MGRNFSNCLSLTLDVALWRTWGYTKAKCVIVRSTFIYFCSCSDPGSIVKEWATSFPPPPASFLVSISHQFLRDCMIYSRTLSKTTSLLCALKSSVPLLCTAQGHSGGQGKGFFPLTVKHEPSLLNQYIKIEHTCIANYANLNSSCMHIFIRL